MLIFITENLAISRNSQRFRAALFLYVSWIYCSENGYISRCLDTSWVFVAIITIKKSWMMRATRVVSCGERRSGRQTLISLPQERYYFNFDKHFRWFLAFQKYQRRPVSIFKSEQSVDYFYCSTCGLNFQSLRKGIRKLKSLFWRLTIDRL